MRREWWRTFGFCWGHDGRCLCTAVQGWLQCPSRSLWAWKKGIGKSCLPPLSVQYFQARLSLIFLSWMKDTKEFSFFCFPFFVEFRSYVLFFLSFLNNWNCYHGKGFDDCTSQRRFWSSLCDWWGDSGIREISHFSSAYHAYLMRDILVLEDEYYLIMDSTSCQRDMTVRYFVTLHPVHLWTFCVRTGETGRGRQFIELRTRASCRDQ